MKGDFQEFFQNKIKKTTFRQTDHNKSSLIATSHEKRPILSCIIFFKFKYKLLVLFFHNYLVPLIRETVREINSCNKNHDHKKVLFLRRKLKFASLVILVGTTSSLQTILSCHPASVRCLRVADAKVRKNACPSLVGII